METSTQNAIAPVDAAVPAVPVPQEAAPLLLRMFADPHVLAPAERADLIGQLRGAVAAQPASAELRVLLGMALCVDFQVQEAIDHLAESVRLSPNSFIAQLKTGELWMRLRVCDKAREHTERAAALACNRAQVELARRQGAAIRTLVQNGVERGGYRSPFAVVGRLRRLWQRRKEEALVPAEG